MFTNDKNEHKYIYKNVILKYLMNFKEIGFNLHIIDVLMDELLNAYNNVNK